MTADNTNGDLTTTGPYGTDGPDLCTCDQAPEGHTDNDCANGDQQ